MPEIIEYYLPSYKNVNKTAQTTIIGDKIYMDRYLQLYNRTEHPDIINAMIKFTGHPNMDLFSRERYGRYLGTERSADVMRFKINQIPLPFPYNKDLELLQAQQLSTQFQRQQSQSSQIDESSNHQRLPNN